MGETLKFLAFSCTHHPLHDPEAIEWLLGQISGYRPDVIVHLGDGHEASAASRFPDEERFTLMDEFVSHNEFLKDVRLAASINGTLKAKLVFLPGNHDDNILSQGRLDPKIRPLCDYHYWEPELVDYWAEPARYEYHRKYGCFHLGQVTFGHGWETGVNADEFHALKLCQPYGLYVGGHLHRPTIGAQRCYRTRRVPLNNWYINPGCMRDMNPYYMRRFSKDLWGQGVVKGVVEVTKSPRLKRMWEANTEIFRMGDDL